MKISICILIFTLGWANCALAQKSPANNADDQCNPNMSHMWDWGGKDYCKAPITTEALYPLCSGWSPAMKIGGKTCTFCWNPMFPEHKVCR